MEIRQLKIFTAVARHLSFTRAAEELDYAQSNITAQIRLLEEEFGTKLFERLGKRIALTTAGDQLLRYAKQILKFACDAKDNISNDETPRGTITVGTAESLCVFRLPTLFKDYCKRYPNVKLIIKLGTPTDLYRWLRDNTIDLTFSLGEEVKQPDLIAETLLPEPIIFVGENEHSLIENNCLNLKDIEQECLILTECGCSYRAALEKILKDSGIWPSSTLEFGSIEAIKQFAASGIGIALLPQAAVVKELTSGQLVNLKWKGPEIQMYTQMVYHKDKWLSPTLNSMIDLVQVHFSGDNMNKCSSLKSN